MHVSVLHVHGTTTSGYYTYKSRRSSTGLPRMSSTLTGTFLVLARSICAALLPLRPPSWTLALSASFLLGSQLQPISNLFQALFNAC